jgi:hypothetical protein
VYKEALKPNITMNSPDKFSDIPGDEKVQAAIRWLNSPMHGNIAILQRSG